MANSFDALSWREYESAQWHRAVRERGLQLRSLDPDERILVFDAITADLERRKKIIGRRLAQLPEASPRPAPLGLPPPPDAA
jgi:hypothetical protein